MTEADAGRTVKQEAGLPPDAGSGRGESPAPMHGNDSGTGGTPSSNKPDTLDAGAGQTDIATTFRVALSPTEEFPTCAAAGEWANGTGTTTISPDSRSLSVELTHSGLSGPPTLAHIHLGDPGFAGPAVLAIAGALDSPIHRTFTAADYTPAKGAPADFASFLDALKSGKTYFNIHTDKCGSGEIRGQISADTAGVAKPRVSRLFTNLSAEVETPVCSAASTSAGGAAAVSISPDRSELNVEIRYQGLSGAPNGAHVHAGPPGQAGPIVLDFGAMLPSPLQRVFHAADYVPTQATPPDFSAFLTSLEAGRAYVNVHTAACPSGEVRGQLVRPALLAELTAAQELPMCNKAGATAIGSGIVIISQDESELELRLSYSGLSSAPIAAQIHAVERGGIGPVVLDLGKALGSPIAKNLKAADFTPPAKGDVKDFATLIKAIKAGNTYFNILTRNCISGEISGPIE